MIYSTPPITPALQEQLNELAKLREALGEEVKTPSRWMGSLRREVRASSIESSTSIEGFSVSPEEALALVSGQESPTATTRTGRRSPATPGRWTTSG